MMRIQVNITIGYTYFSALIPIPNPSIAPTAGTLTIINTTVKIIFAITINSHLPSLKNSFAAHFIATSSSRKPFVIHISLPS